MTNPMTTPMPKIAEVLRSLADNTVTGLPTFCWACGQQDWVQPCRKCLRIAADALDAAGRLPTTNSDNQVDAAEHEWAREGSEWICKNCGESGGNGTDPSAMTMAKCELLEYEHESVLENGGRE